MSDSTRQLKIKTGVVKRLFKEEQSYRTEVNMSVAKLETLRSDGADDADIRNAERVVKDSEQMIPRTRRQLEEALVVLEDLIDALKADEAAAGTQEYADAVGVAQQVQAAWKTDGN